MIEGQRDEERRKKEGEKEMRGRTWRKLDRDGASG